MDQARCWPRPTARITSIAGIMPHCRELLVWARKRDSRTVKIVWRSPFGCTCGRCNFAS
jgi:hypothetical protein